MNEILTKLKAPFPVDKLSWRIGQKSNWDKRTNSPKNPDKPVKAMMLVYIDSRDVQDRLDEVCGMDWSDSYSEVMGRLVCSITINGITRTDGAGDTDFEAEKGGLSDAFKRAAVKWGVGRYLYNAKDYNTWVDCTGMSDFDVYKNNKEQLDQVAMLISKGVNTYKYYLKCIDESASIAELERVKDEARVKAKEELWSTGNLQTFKEHCVKKENELKEKQNEQQAE